VSTNLDMRIVAHDHASKVFGEVGQSANQLEGRLSRLGNSTAMQQGAAAGGAAAAVGLVGAFSSVMDKGAIDAKMSARLNLSAQDSQRYGKLSGEIYAAGFGGSMADVGDAMSVMHSQIGAQNDEMTKRSTQNLLNLAATFDQDLAKSAAAAGNMIKNGLAKDSDEAFDVITRGMQLGVNKSDDLLDTLNEYSPQFAKLGLSATQATGLLSQGLKGGARDSDTVADSLKEFSIRAIDGSKLTAEGFKAIGVSGARMAADIAAGGPRASAALGLTLDKLRGIKDPVKQSAAAVALFGTKAEDMGKALLTMDVGKATSEMGKVSGAAKKLNDTVSSADKAALTSFVRTLKTNLIDALMPVIKALASLGKYFSEHPAAAKILATSLLGLAAAVTVFVIAVKTASLAAKVWAGAQAALNFVLAANPIGLAVVAIAALVAAVVWAYKNVGWFRNAVQATGKASAAAFKKIGDWVMSTVVWIDRAWSRMTRIIVSPIVAAVRSTILSWRQLGAAVQAFVVYAGRRIWALKDTASRAFSAIGSFVASRVSSIRSMWSNMWSGVSSIAGSFVTRVVNAVERIRRAFSGVVNAVKSLWNGSIGGFSFQAPSWVPGLGGKGIKIPFLAEGGIVSSPTLAMIGEGGEPEMVLPLSKARAQGFGGGNGQTIVINVTQPLGSPEAIAREVTKAFNSSRSRGSIYSQGVF